MKTNPVKVIGAGLAGSEAAYQLLKRGVDVELYEMRPAKNTPAHSGGGFAELVCSNSLKSTDPATPQGELKRELRLMDSLLLRSAEKASVSAGGALAVNRAEFSELVESSLKQFPNLKIIRCEATELTDNTIVCAGPLASDAIASKLERLCGNRLNFYDAVAPIVTADSIDMSRAYFMSRYGKGEADYLNCPMDREEYYAFADALMSSERVVLKEFEKRDIFNDCQPVEYMADKGRDTLRFGPLRPVGLYPQGEKRPFAVVQLRAENAERSAYNIVGFQTNLKFSEQKRVFSMIPALKNAEFARYGVMHRNTYLDSPSCLNNDMSVRGSDGIFVAGQLSGSEGYVESIATGALCGLNMYLKLQNMPYLDLPDTSALGSLVRYVTQGNGLPFVPMHVSFTLMPTLVDVPRDKQLKKQMYADRAFADFSAYVNKLSQLFN